jgi:hypothetical protein
LPPTHGEALQPSWHRAIASHVLARTSNKNPHTIAESCWPNDPRAFAIAKAATLPTLRVDYPAFDLVESFRSLAPGSAALALFQMGLKLDLRSIIRPEFRRWRDCHCNQFSLPKARRFLSAVTSEVADATPETASAVIGRVLADFTNRSIDAKAFGT